MKSKITPDAYFVMLLFLSVLFHFFLPIVKVIPYLYSLAGIIPIVTGIILVYRTNYILLKNRTSVQPFETPSVFITSGLFRLSRNPIYLGMGIILFGVEMILGTLSPFIFPFIFLIIMNQSIIPKEETKIEKIFGEKYLDYKSKVRRWI